MEDELGQRNLSALSDTLDKAMKVCDELEKIDPHSSFIHQAAAFCQNAYSCVHEGTPRTNWLGITNWVNRLVGWVG